MKKVYLSGSIFENPDPKTWRDIATRNLPTGWKAINPLDYDISNLSPKELVVHDYDIIRKCDAILARVDFPSWGTAMELCFSKALGIPVIAWTTNGPPMAPWLCAHIDSWYTDLNKACGALADV